MTDQDIVLFIIVLFYIGLFLSFILWVWSIIHILTNKFKEDMNKIIWLLVVIFIPIFGPFLYFFIGKNQVIKE